MDIMNLGIMNSHPTPQPEWYKNDLIHPCVRYIESGINGHQWWMVGTPIVDGSKIEDPILFYGDTQPNGEPPSTWTSVGVVEPKPTPSGAYNADPCLYYDNTTGLLWIIFTSAFSDFAQSNGTSVATVAKTYDGGNFSELKFIMPSTYDIGITGSLGTNGRSPIVININGNLKLIGGYGVISPPVGLPKTMGLSFHSLDLLNETAILEKKVGQLYRKNFEYWHFDFFQHNEKYYSVTTAEAANEILFGISEDGENYKYYSKPLISTEGSGAQYLYKASAMVYNGNFYLWYPVRNPVSRISTIHTSKMEWSELLNSIEASVFRL